MPSGTLDFPLAERSQVPVADLPLDDLRRLQLRVARRADERARRRERDVAHGCGETAERELLPDALRRSA